MDWFRLFCHFPKLFLSLILQTCNENDMLCLPHMVICLTFSDCFLLLEKSLKGLKFDWLHGAGTLIYSFYELKKTISGMQVFRFVVGTCTLISTLAIDIVLNAVYLCSLNPTKQFVGATKLNIIFITDKCWKILTNVVFITEKPLVGLAGLVS